MSILNKILNIFKSASEADYVPNQGKSSVSDTQVWNPTRVSSTTEHGRGFEEDGRSSMEPLRPGIEYQIMEKSPVEQNSIDIDDPCNTKRMKRW